MADPTDGTPEPPAKRGDAAWREQRDAVSQRNAEAHSRAQTQQNTRDDVIADRTRRDAQREADQLRALNAQIEKGKKR